MFGKRKEEMMVYVVMGFLEAGKTICYCMQLLFSFGSRPISQ